MNVLNKKIICITSVCLMMIIFYNKAQSQSGWYQLNSGTVNNLNSVSFLNEFTGYMVGDGLGIKTTNGGFNWYVIPQISGGTSVSPRIIPRSEHKRYFLPSTMASNSASDFLTSSSAGTISSRSLNRCMFLPSSPNAACAS